MQSRKLLNSFIEEMINNNLFSNNSSVINDYKELNDKCEDVIAKIKARKAKEKIDRGENGWKKLDRKS